MPIKNKLHTEHFSSENKMVSSVMTECMPNTESSPGEISLNSMQSNSLWVYTVC